MHDMDNAGFDFLGDESLSGFRLQRLEVLGPQDTHGYAILDQLRSRLPQRCRLQLPD